MENKSADLIEEHKRLVEAFQQMQIGYRKGKEQLAQLLTQIDYLEKQYEIEREQERLDKREVIKLQNEMAGAK